MQNYVLSVLVRNHAGVLSRVTGLFGRRGYNIESLSVAATQRPEFSRITLVVRGDDYLLEQVIKQVRKLEEVLSVRPLTEEQSVSRELLLIKFGIGEDASGLIRALNPFGARVVDLSPGSLIAELTGPPREVDRFLEALAPFGPAEVCRTGLTALARGEDPA